MCRHLGYVGRPVVLSRLFFDAPHSMEHQSYAPRELLEGNVNADGFGVAWYPPVDGSGDGVGVAGGGERPLVYRSERPAWADLTWKTLAPRLLGRAVVVNVRNATDPATGGVGGVHPYTEDRWSFTHNGFLTGFREHHYRDLGRELSDKRYRMRRGSSDTETLFLLLMDRIERGAGGEEALLWLVKKAGSVAQEAGEPAYLNFILSDGESVWATRFATKPRQASLYVGSGLDSFPDASLVASEALDEDPGWSPVPESSLVVLRAGKEPEVRGLTDRDPS